MGYIRSLPHLHPAPQADREPDHQVPQRVPATGSEDQSTQRLRLRQPAQTVDAPTCIIHISHSQDNICWIGEIWKTCLYFCKCQAMYSFKLRSIASKLKGWKVDITTAKDRRVCCSGEESKSSSKVLSRFTGDSGKLRYPNTLVSFPYFLGAWISGFSLPDGRELWREKVVFDCSNICVGNRWQLKAPWPVSTPAGFVLISPSYAIIYDHWFLMYALASFQVLVVLW